MTLISPGDCTLQCGMWLWNHDSEFTKWQHLAMWQEAVGWHAMELAQTSAILKRYIWFRFWPYHRSPHVILYQSAKFLSKSDHPQQKKNDVMSILMMANLSHLGFYGFNNGFFEKPMYDFVQVVNRDHSSKLLVFEKIAFFAFWRQTDRQTDELINKQMDSTDALSRSRCRERRLNNQSVNQSVSQSVSHSAKNRLIIRGACISWRSLLKSGATAALSRVKCKSTWLYHGRDYATLCNPCVITLSSVFAHDYL